VFAWSGGFLKISWRVGMVRGKKVSTKTKATFGHRESWARYTTGLGGGGKSMGRKKRKGGGSNSMPGSQN